MSTYWGLLRRLCVQQGEGEFTKHFWAVFRGFYLIWEGDWNTPSDDRISGGFTFREL